jgi:hypothetical protein
MFPVGITPANLVLLSEKFRETFQDIHILEEVGNLNLPRFGWAYDGTLIRFSSSGVDTTLVCYHNLWSGQILFQASPKFLRGYQDSPVKRWMRTALPILGSIFSHGLIPLRDMVFRAFKSRI